MPLGFRGGTGYEARALRLEPDDFLFLYTDGVTEARNVSEEEFGALRVCSGLAALRSRPAGDVVHSVLDAVQAFRGGAPQMDDVSAMAIRWRG